MSIFDIITLFGGLAMFLYGMRIMGDGLKESSSGSLKAAMEKLTNTPIKAFLLGLVVTAVIQSSTATIVITSGLVGAGVLTLHQSLGIVIGANVGTTVTGQIIRLLDLNASGTSFLQFFKPSTLAPLALIIGIVLIMFCKFKNSNLIGQIAMGFGILFAGLLNMTDAVNALSDSGMFERVFTSLGDNPVVGYAAGAAVAFVLQSSSASVGILQALSTSGVLTFNGIYAVLVGIYLGDCVTTAIVCYIGAKPDQKRVGIINILFNLCKTVVVFVGVTVLHKLGALDWIWRATVNSGIIANTNTIFNLASAILLLPLIRTYEKLGHKLVKDEVIPAGKYDDLLDKLNPVFFSTPRLALSSSYDVLLTMYRSSRTNIEKAFMLVDHYDEALFVELEQEEDCIDSMTDRVCNYLAQISAHLTTDADVARMNQYMQVASEFERLGDHAMNIAEAGKELSEMGNEFTEDAQSELAVLRVLIGTILDYAGAAFESDDLVAARHIEPLEEVVDDMVSVLKGRHLERLRSGKCTVDSGTTFFNLLSDIERVSDICSNVGVETVACAQPELHNRVHDYISQLHAGQDEAFNREYHEVHEKYFALLQEH